MIPALDELREYFTLDRAGERAKSLSDDDRRALRHDLDLSTQKREAAEILWQSGARAEALRLVREALDLIERHAKLAELQAPNGDVAALPTFDQDVTEEHHRRFDAWLQRHVDFLRRLGPVALATPERKARTVSRLTVVSAALVATVVLGVVWYRRVDLTAEANVAWGPQYSATFTVDGNEATHWLLPDKTPGHVEIKIAPAKKLTAVSILNGYDPPAYGMKDFRVEAFHGTAMVKSVDGSFPSSNGVKPPWRDVTIDAKEPIDRVRIVVKSWHDLGGSIAEVKVK